MDLIAVIVIVIMYPLVLAPISLIIVNVLKGQTTDIGGNDELPPFFLCYNIVSGFLD